MERAETGQGIGAEFRHGDKNAPQGLFFLVAGLAGLGFVGIADEPLQEGSGHECAVQGEGEVIGDDVLPGKSGSGMPFSYPGAVFRGAFAAQQVGAQ